MSEFYIIIARKIFFPNFRGHVPSCPPSPTPSMLSLNWASGLIEVCSTFTVCASITTTPCMATVKFRRKHVGLLFLSICHTRYEWFQVLSSRPRCSRGLRVNPYPRVRVGAGRCFTGTGIPAFTREISSQVTQLLTSFVVTVWWKVDKLYLLNYLKGVLVRSVHHLFLYTKSRLSLYP